MTDTLREVCSASQGPHLDVTSSGHIMSYHGLFSLLRQNGNDETTLAQVSLEGSLVPLNMLIIDAFIWKIWTIFSSLQHIGSLKKKNFIVFLTISETHRKTGPTTPGEF